MNDLPMFPLGSALLPGNLLPLQIFEPRYLTMLRDIAGGDGRFGVVLIERGFEVGGGDQRFAIGTVASIEQLQPTADGRVRLLARGEERFEVVNWLPDAPYPRARCASCQTWSGGTSTPRAWPTPSTSCAALVVVSEYRAPLWSADVELSEDPVTRSWQLAGVAPLGALDQLALLRSSSVEELLERTAQLTARRWTCSLCSSLTTPCEERRPFETVAAQPPQGALGVVPSRRLLRNLLRDRWGVVPSRRLLRNLLRERGCGPWRASSGIVGGIMTP